MQSTTKTILAILVFALTYYVMSHMQNPTVEMTSDSMGSTLTSVDAMGNKTVCRADVMPGGSVVSRCY